MGTFTFKWPHAAEEVYVTGTFDNWTKSEQLEKVRDVFQKTVTLPETSEKVYYKFVVDGKWITDHAAPTEKDHEGNDNNVLQPDDITKMEESNPAAAIINSVGPESITAQLAGAVPLEEKKEEATPVAATIDTVGPEATTAKLAGEVPLEKKEEKAGEDQTEEKKDDVATGPGSYPETPAADLDKQVKIDPIPATDINAPPIKLEPGEKIPEGVVAGSINDHVTLDKESYEKSDRLPGLETSDAPLFELPPITNDLIPESSLPIAGPGDATINSVGPNATTAELAGKVPLEPKVPEIVKESQREAHVDPEASAISEEVREKAAVEEELLKKVPEAPAASENITSVAEAVVAASAAVATAAVGAAIVAKDSIVDAASSAAEKLPGAAAATKETVTDVAADVVDNKVPAAVEAAVTAKDTAVEAAISAKDTAVESAATAKDAVVDAATNAAEKLPEPIKDVLPTSTEESAPEVENAEPVSSEVPAQVKESIEEADQSPEAAANTDAVEDKKEVEAELLKEVKPVEPAAESEPVQIKPLEVAESSTKEEKLPETVAPEVPVAVKESIEGAAVAPEAAANTAAIEDKKEVEAELLKEVKPVESAPEATKPVETKPAEPTPEASKPVETKPAVTQPETNGAKAAAVPAESTTKPTDGTATVEKKKKNRLSAMFSKLKHKLEGKDKS